ncbi:MAG: metallophosphoesterase [Bdellovibrionaceae bacterium]|nr:metallophosphoesterase [Bdellovibrio sp.]
MKIRIAHLSDPHFGANYPEVVNALTSSMKDLKPSLIILSGDITQRARCEQFVAAEKFVQQLAEFPWAIVPGNHDIPLFNIFARLFYPYKYFKNVFKGLLEKEIPVKSVHVFTLNSTSRFRHVQGALSAKQIKKIVADPLAETDVRIACFHHPMDCPKTVDEKNLLRNRDEAMQVFAKAGIDLILGGHIHDPYVNLSGERYPNVKRQSIISVAGTCLSWRTRAGAPNSFHLIDIDTADKKIPRLVITRYDLQSNKQFTPILVQSFFRDLAQGWIKN